MKQAERQRIILELLTQNHTVLVADLCEQFNVSEMTVRRDLRALENEGLLRRTHGGAVSNLGRSYEPPLPVRSGENTAAKQAIGRAAAELVRDGHSIALDVGTTTLEIVRALSGKHNLTILTASLPIAMEIIGKYPMESDVRLILTGGIVRAGELSLVGDIAIQTYSTLHVDLAFIGAGGVDIDDGMTEYNLEDTQVKQALLKTAQRKILVADSTKFGRTTFASIAPLETIDMVITDADIEPEIVRALKQMRVQVLIAD